jgi:hypothetical protein
VCEEKKVEKFGDNALAFRGGTPGTNTRPRLSGTKSGHSSRKMQLKVAGARIKADEPDPSKLFQFILPANNLRSPQRLSTMASTRN